MSFVRPVKFHDLAFFDPVIYESLRQLVVDAEKPGSDNATALQVQKIEKHSMEHCNIRLLTGTGLDLLYRSLH